MSIIFIHIPKAAGTSIRVALKQSPASDRVVPIYNNRIGVPLEDAREQDLRDKIIYGHVGFGIHKNLGIPPVYATVIRHPVDRIVSLYGHFARNPETRVGQDIASGLSLHEILSDRVFGQFHDHMTRMVSGMTTAKGIGVNALDRAKENLGRHFRFVCVLDRLDANLAALRGLFGIPTLAIGKQNVSDGPRLEIDDDLRSLILRSNELDTELFEYVRRTTEEREAFAGQCVVHAPI